MKEKAFPAILAKIYDQAMVAEREAHLGAGTYERAEERDGYANGFKPRSLQTRAGRLSLRVPQVRGSSTRFYPKCLERGAKSERSHMLAAAEMYVQGVSTRRGEAVFQAMLFGRAGVECGAASGRGAVEVEVAKDRAMRQGAVH